MCLGLNIKISELVDLLALKLLRALELVGAARLAPPGIVSIVLELVICAVKLKSAFFYVCVILRI